MKLTAHEVCSASYAKKFVDFQFKLYKGCENWVPPLKSSEVKSIYPNKAWKDFCEAKFWIAYRGHEIVGTIGAIINKLHIEKTGENFGRFTKFECIDDQTVANFLFDTAESWLKEKGMEKVHGPLSFSNLETQGLLIEGFEYLPSIGSIYHKKYYNDLVTNYGYQKENDWIEFRLTVDEKAIEKGDRLAKVINERREKQGNKKINIIHFNKTSEILKLADGLFEVLDKSFSEIPYSIPLNKKLRKYYVDKYLRFVNPKFIKLAKIDNKIIGFVVMMPSVSKALQKANGSLFPTGFYHLLKAKNGHTDTLDSLLGGILPEYQSTGAIVLMFSAIHQSLEQYNMKYIETTGIYEHNHNAIYSWENYDGVQHKRRRCYIKNLN